MKYLLLLSISIACLTIHGQTTFELRFGTDLSETPFDIIENDDSYIIVGARQDNLNFSINPTIYQISKDGQLLDWFEYSKYDTISQFTNLVRMNGKIMIIGNVGRNESNASKFSAFNLSILNDSFQIINERIIPLPQNYTGISNYYIKQKNANLIIAGDARHIDYSNYSHDIFICEINTLTDSVKYDFTLKEGIQYVSGMSLLPDSYEKYIFSVGDWGFPVGYGPGYYVKFDENNQFILADTLPNGLQWENYSMNVSNNHFLLSGRQIAHPNGFPNSTEHRCTLYKLNHEFHVESSYEYSMGVDTLSLLASVNTFDTTATGEIYISGCSNVNPQYFPFQNDPSWIFLSKLDRNLNHIWTRFYGGDMFYQVLTVKATIDGGAIMTCRTYDSKTQYYEHDILILKVNEDGLIVGTKDESSGLTIQDAIVYPNPGSTMLNICSGLQISGASFELFSLNGNLLHSTTLDERIETLNTSKLAHGTYPYLIIFKNKIVGSGKWNKE